MYILSGPKYIYEALGFPKEIFIEADKLATSNIKTELTLVTTDENKIKAQQLAMLLMVFQIKKHKC